MIKDYKIVQKLDTSQANFNKYLCTKQTKKYFIYQYKEMNQCDQYNFKVIKKLITCTKVIGVIERFQLENQTYFVTEHVDSNLLKQLFQQANHIFELSKSLAYFAQIVQIIEELHQNNVIYRNFRMETLGLRKNQIFLTDFTLSQIVRRKQRYFQIVGVPDYYAPQFFSENGYGYQADIWAAGVILYYMITGQYPFNMKNKSEQEMAQQIQKKCKKGFNFLALARETKRAKYIQSSKPLQDLFKRIFEIDYFQRITISELQSHPAIKQHFSINNNLTLGQDLLSKIQQQSLQYQQSIIVSQLTKYPCCYEFHKQQVILDFLQSSSETFMLDSSKQISEQLRCLVNFSILKVGVMKAKNMIDMIYGIKPPNFKIDPQEWQQLRKSAAFGKMKQKLQKKKKILQMLFRAAFINIQNYNLKPDYYSQEIPNDFSQIKHEYRKNLSKMFELFKQIMKKKQSSKIVRKNCQNLVRLTILCLINRLFQQAKFKQNFNLYFTWAKKQTFESLQDWIQNQKMTNLKNFIKFITSKYME